MTVWNIAKWPVLVVVVMLMFAVLYYAGAERAASRSSAGSRPAASWRCSSGSPPRPGSAFYVANFGSYNKTYGTLGGVIIFLVWLWISNIAVLFGAEFDAELERSRQLEAGLPAEETLQLPEREPAKESAT